RLAIRLWRVRSGGQSGLPHLPPKLGLYRWLGGDPGSLALALPADHTGLVLPALGDQDRCPLHRPVPARGFDACLARLSRRDQERILAAPATFGAMERQASGVAASPKWSRSFADAESNSRRPTIARKRRAPRMEWTACSIIWIGCCMPPATATRRRKVRARPFGRWPCNGTFIHTASDCVTKSRRGFLRFMTSTALFITRTGCITS